MQRPSFHPAPTPDAVSSPDVPSDADVPRITPGPTAGPPPSTRHLNPITGVDARALEAALRARLRGEVRFDDGSRALYATDGSNYRQTPIGVIMPRDADDVVTAVGICRQFDAPVLPRGGGTSLAGQCCNVAVVMDMTRYMHHVVDLDPVRMQARVQPGLVLDDLRDRAEKHHLTFGPDPATHNHCTLGGMIGNNSCGVHSVMAGRTADNIEELEILTYDGLRMRVGRTPPEELSRIMAEGGRRGEIYTALANLRDRYADQIRARYPHIPRRVSGYNLDELLPENGFQVARALVGSEGTCVTVLEATTRLVHSPPCRSLLVLGYPDVYHAADHIMEVLEHKPIGLEGLDQEFISDMKKKKVHPEDLELMPEGTGWLLIEFGGESKEEADEKARGVMEAMKKQADVPSMKLFDDKVMERKVWEVREAGLGATARIPGQKDNWEGWEDSAVPPAKVGAYLAGLRKLLKKYDYHGSLYGHFGDGCIHTRLDFDLKTKEGVEQYRAFIGEASDLVLSFGGSLSGEHGDGQSRAELLPKMFGEELVRAFGEFKAIWDPQGRMNPRKVVDPYRITENLRYGPTYHPPQVATHFKFPNDKGSFAYATERCVGVGECRKEHAGTMCPSYMATREEEHSTRGRAHLLFEMLRGDPLTGGWQDEHVKESLDLCLACKGCLGECPVQVDLATYKAEFLSHYYEGHRRPLYAYAFGWINRWSRLASYVPGLANFVMQAPLLGRWVKDIVGISRERRVPAFAPVTFRDWFTRRPVCNEGQPKVMLWPDTFNNYFHPETARAAVEVLEAAGYQVVIPRQVLCCGRPLYDFGMLDTAKQYLRSILDAIRPEIEGGMSVVGLEPSCLAVFRDELVNFFPMDEDAKRLSAQSFLLSEFLEKKVQGYRPPPLHAKALVHGHCHHKAVMKMTDEASILKKSGMGYQVLDSGCCGMAGAFGFEADHYEVSMKVGERVLLPAVRAAARDTVIVADGFSCREQIAQSTDRQALHLAQVLQMGLREGPERPARDYPERGYVGPEALEPERQRSSGHFARGVALGMAGVVMGGVLAVWMRRRAG